VDIISLDRHEEIQGDPKTQATIQSADDQNSVLNRIKAC